LWYQANLDPKKEKRKKKNPKDMDSISTEKRLGMVACACYPRFDEKHKTVDWSRPTWAKARPYIPKQPDQKGLGDIPPRH
jgi:hypothetical protein